MKLQSLAISLVLAPVVFTSSLAFSQGGVERLEPLNPQPVAQADLLFEEMPNAWFIELSGKPIADGGNPAQLAKEKKAFRAAAAKAGIPFTERYAFDTLWNGVSVNADMAAAAKLANISGVAAIYPVVAIDRPEPVQTAGSVPELYTALGMTGADIAQSDLGFTGAGVKVAVMDTGIDYDHPDLGGCFGEGCRVAFGYDLVGDDFNADPGSPSYNPVPVPDDDPDDCQGHGTHVAGIVGADGTVTGVAPNVTFGAYRVFGCEGSTTSDIMIAAMEMALADGMDVLNMSIGSAFQWPQYPTAAASDRMVNKGMVVVASIGNSGSTGIYSAGAPGVGKKVIGTASFDNSHLFGPYFEVDGQKIGYNQMSSADPAPTAGTEEIVYVGRGCDGDPYLADPAGKVALIVRGTCSFNVKATNALAAGAIAAVVHNNVPGNFNGTLGTYVPIVAVSISLADGLFIRGLEPVDMTWTDEQDSFPNPTGGLISAFSSYGLAPDLSLKPDIGAPGGGIYSTYPLEYGGYATLSGTSMASPHVAGAAALLLEAHPNTPSQAVRGILQNSADPAAWWGNPGLGFLDNVHRQGAGMLDIDDSILSTTKIEPAKIAAGESEAGPFVQVLSIENNAADEVTYDVSFVNALSTGPNTFSPSFFLGNANVSFDMASVVVPAGGTASVTATISGATSPVGGQYGGYIVFTPQGGGQVYRVPFAGYIGDYQARQVLAPTIYGFPRLGWTLDGINFGFADPYDVFTMQGFDVPYFLVHLDHQSRLFRVEIFAEGGKAWHRAYNSEYMPRNSGSNSFFAFDFDGTTTAGKKEYELPNGNYYAVISVLKALGDDDNPDHWETWTSPVFIIDRP